MLFQILSNDRSMSEFISHLSLYEFLHVLKLPQIHWKDQSRWLMVEHLFSFVKGKHKTMICDAQYVVLTIDESIFVENTSWIVVH